MCKHVNMCLCMCAELSEDISSLKPEKSPQVINEIKMKYVKMEGKEFKELNNLLSL